MEGGWEGCNIDALVSCFAFEFVIWLTERRAIIRFFSIIYTVKSNSNRFQGTKKIYLIKEITMSLRI